MSALREAILDEVWGLVPEPECLVRVEEVVAAINSRWSIETRHDELDRPLVEAAALAMWEAIRECCPACLTPSQSATEHGYSCPVHRPLYLALAESLRGRGPST